MPARIATTAFRQGRKAAVGATEAFRHRRMPSVAATEGPGQRQAPSAGATAAGGCRRRAGATPSGRDGCACNYTAPVTLGQPGCYWRGSFFSFPHFMKHFSTTASFLKYARRGALLLALGAAGPAAWGQSFGPVRLYSAGSGSALDGVVLGDVDGNGSLDVVVANYGANGVGVLFGQAAGGFAAISPLYPTGPNSVPSGIALGDVNGDGRLDVVTANKSTYSAGVLLGQAAGSFATVSTYSAGPNTSPLAVALGDVNGDGRLDIVTANYFADAIGVLLGQASGGFAAVSAYPTGTGSRPCSVALGDVNGDGRLDIVTANTDGNAAGVLLGQAGGTFAAIATYATGAGSAPADVALGDVNGDGRLDIVTVNTRTSTAGVLLAQTGGGFGLVSTYSTNGSTPQGLALGDVTGDGRLDIVTANSVGSVSVLRGLAGGAFATVVPYSIGTGTTPADVALGDVNGDGRLDIVTVLFTFTANNVGVLLNTGTFTPLATARPTAAEVALYPNPAHGSFTVQLPAALGPVQAELLNALGQVVRRPAAGLAGGSFPVETSGLAAGVYTLRLQVGGAALARRVVVE